MKNPFIFGRPVSGKHFINRKDELADFSKLLNSGNNIIVSSKRQVGKTSLLLKIKNTLKKDGYAVIYLDLFLVRGFEEFLSYFLTETSKTVKANAGRITSWITTSLKSIQPSFSIDDKGSLNFSINLQHNTRDNTQLLKEILELPLNLNKLFRKKVRGIIVIFDEFQRIYEIGGKDLEAKMRSIMQHHKQINYIFSGSNQTLINEAFLNSKRPFYEWGILRSIGPLEKNELRNYIQNNFAKKSVSFEKGCFNEIIEICDGVPNFIQMFFFFLWNIHEGPCTIDTECIKKAVDEILLSNNSFYQNLISNLSEMQTRLLKGIATLGGANVTSSGFLVESRLRNSATAIKSGKALLHKNLIYKDTSGYTIKDPFFKIWLKQLP